MPAVLGSLRYASGSGITIPVCCRISVDGGADVQAPVVTPLLLPLKPPLIHMPVVVTVPLLETHEALFELELTKIPAPSSQVSGNMGWTCTLPPPLSSNAQFTVVLRTTNAPPMPAPWVAIASRFTPAVGALKIEPKNNFRALLSDPDVRFGIVRTAFG